MKYMTTTLAGTLVLALGAAVLADGHASDRQLESAVKARQAQMNLYSFNLGTLGSMAKGDIEYDADAAQAAADNLAALASLSQAGYWLPGTDSDSMEGSRALPAIWGADSTAGQLGMDFAAAALAMQEAAGTDLSGLQGAMSGVGDACSACHEAYRKPRG